METQPTVYNVLWVDDQIDSLTSDMSAKRLLREFKVRIIKAHHAAEYRNLMDIYYPIIDAVITDVNFNKDQSIAKGDRDTSGFENVRSSIEKYNEQRVIPYYLLSAKGQMIEEKYDDESLEYFIQGGRKFASTQLRELLEKLTSEVDHIQSPSFRIRNQYALEIEAAGIIPEVQDTLIYGLLYEYSDSWTNTQDYFTPARKIVERIFTECKNKRVLPTANLNDVKHLLKNDKNRKFFMIKSGCEIMPKALIHSLEFFLDITQDGSHSYDDLELGVDSYVRKVRNINLYRSILSIAMDMCLWYKEVYNNIDSYLDHWEIDKRTIEDYGIVSEMKTERGDILLRCNNYQLHNDCKCVPGQSIGIKKSSENKRKRQILASEGIVMIDRYVYPGDIVLID